MNWLTPRRAGAVAYVCLALAVIQGVLAVRAALRGEVAWVMADLFTAGILLFLWSLWRWIRADLIRRRS